MSTPNDGGPAFPIVETFGSNGVKGRMENGYGGVRSIGGMSLRMWLAGQALNGFISAGYDCGNPESVAKDCFDFADAIIKEASK